VLELALAILISAAPEKTKDPETPPIPGVEQPQVDEPKSPELTKTEPIKAEPPAKKEPAAKPEPAKAEEKKEAKAEAKKAEKTLPPAVTQSGLCAELNRNGLSVAAQRKKLEEERKDIAAQREELEKIAADIAKSRAELRVETERLEALLGQAPGGNGTAPNRAQVNGTVGQGQLETLAKALKGMKPDSAAALMQRTDPKLAAQLLQRMKPADAGAVMDHLKPDLAADLLAQMATLPAPRKP